MKKIELYKKIPTLAGGEISPDELEFTLIHEHLLFTYDKKFTDKCIRYTQKELQRYELHGGRSLVDLTPFRPIQIYQKMIEDVGLNIICCTGYYTHKYIEEILKDKEALEGNCASFQEKMRREIYEGIDGSKIRAGIIKVSGMGDRLTPWEKEVFTAAAKVQKETAVPIATHAARGANDQQLCLLNSGADPSHIFFSHIEAKFGWEGRTVQEEAEHLLQITKRGSYLLFNNFGTEQDTPAKDLYYILRYLADKGSLERILISIDMYYHMDEKGNFFMHGEEEYPELKVKVYSYVYYEVIPALRRIGFTEEEIRTIFIENPKRFFTTK